MPPFFNRIVLALAMLSAATPALAQDPIKVFAAGSLTGPLTVLAKQFSASTGESVETVFGPSGLLLERLEQGERADVFASANMAHPQQLAREGKAIPALVFARNSVCVVARPELGLSTQNLLNKLLDPSVKFGTSTPQADPGGDYAWQFFAKAGAIRPGAKELLEAKAQQLVGGRHSPAIPAGRDAVKYFLEQKQVDAFIGYCSSRQTVADTTLTKVVPPAELAIAADFGLTVLNKPAGSHDAAYRFALFLLSPEAQKTLAAYGFSPL
ncbi:molybdenum ABC transporter, molybdate-binding protein [Collimonas sp. OK607]|uniref:molybdate ABC transporter substrate-binding protein n=1 Tax=Collimonas sp. OK607 TaxID=1798194 RepID=UPI0008F3DC18|nr:molybdate ABC transporter substrate-binding protein [Collimonas sp. OK607]SFB24937.1 molybdenum ABC transporter, molybdate-binding protein [Collimonas sp. OK607]